MCCMIIMIAIVTVTAMVKEWTLRLHRRLRMISLDYEKSLRGINNDDCQDWD